MDETTRICDMCKKPTPERAYMSFMHWHAGEQSICENCYRQAESDSQLHAYPVDTPRSGA